MGEWEKVKLSEIAKLVKGKQIDKNNICEDGMYYHLNGGIFPSNYTNVYNTEKNTISISEGGNSCGYVKWNEERFFSGGHNYTIQKINNKILDKYLYFYLKYNEKNIMKLKVGSGLPNIQKKDLEKIQVYFPSKLEQEKIVKILNNIENVIKYTDKDIELLKKQKNAIFNNFLKQKNFFNNNKKWETYSFSDFIKPFIEKTSNTSKYPLYSLTIESGIIPKSERYEREFLVKKKEDIYKVVPPNAFAYNPMNARFGAIKANHESFSVLVSGYYDIFLVGIEKTLPFWENYLISTTMIKVYNSIATGTLIEKQRVHFSKFINIKMELPSTSEQEKISNILNDFEQLINKKIEKKENYEKLKIALMQQLLTGKVKIKI